MIRPPEEIKSRHVYYLLALTLLGMFLVAMSWEFGLEDIIVPVLHSGYTPESLFERWEYVVTSVSFFAVALILPGWLALRSVAQSERANESLNRAHDKLAERVQQRTAELTQANEQLKRALAERQRSEDALRKSEHELRLLSSRLLTAQEDERQRVARDLHDSVSQSLGALKFRVEAVLDKSNQAGGEIPSDLNDVLVPLIQGVIEEVRSIYMGLRPSLLDDLGIGATINWFCREFQDAYPDIQVQPMLDIAESEIPESLKIVIFRTLQEGLCNVARHGRAGRVQVSLLRRNAHVEFIMQDDGVGLQPDGLVSFNQVDSEMGIGLGNMRERVELAGGSFDIQVRPGAGTRVHTAFPLEQDNRL